MNIFRYLSRIIADDTQRSLYSRETSYRQWSVVQLDQQFRAGLFSQYRQPSPAWRQTMTGRVLDVVSTSKGLFIVRSTKLASVQTDEAEYFPVYEGHILEINTRDGTERNIGTLECQERYMYVTFLGGCLYLSSITGLHCYDGHVLRHVVHSEVWQHGCAPVQVEGSIVSFWNDPDKERFRLALVESGRCCWSAKLKGHVCNAVASGTAVIVRVGGPCDSNTKLIRIELQDMLPKETGDVSGNTTLLKEGGQLFSGDARYLRVAEDIGNDFDQQPVTYDDNEFYVVGSFCSGKRMRHAVSCFDPKSLTKVRQWNIAGQEGPQSLLALPEGRGLIVSCEKEIHAIVSDYPRPIILDRWHGTVLGEPLKIGTKVFWIVHRYNNPYLYEDDEWAEDDTNYVFEILDYVTGRWSFIPVNFHQPLHSMHLCDNMIVLIGLHELFGFKITDLLDVMVHDKSREIDPLHSFPDTSKVVSDLPLTGPLNENWACEVSPDLALEMLPPKDRSAWLDARNGNERFRLWQRRVKEDLAKVRRWPDYLGRAASHCPQEFLDLTSSIASECKSSPPFGTSTWDISTIDRILNWKRTIESNELISETSDEALRCARMLLYEYSMRCASGRSWEYEIKNRWGKEGVESVWDLPDAVRDVISWLNLAHVRPGPNRNYFGWSYWLMSLFAKPAIVSSLLWGAGVFLEGAGPFFGNIIPPTVTRIAGMTALISGGACGAAFSVLRALGQISKNRRDLDSLDDIGRRWPNGCPPLMKDADAFVRFIQDCALERLLDPIGRTELQEAVARLWEHPVVNGGQMAFISYSHKQEELARKIVEALRARGIGAILDLDELGRQANDVVIENWIAESTMRSVTTVYLVSDNAKSSGWVHREVEWLLRLQGTKSNLVLPYIVAFGDTHYRWHYPQCRIIDGIDLINNFEKTLTTLAARIVMDWLLILRTKRQGKQFGIAYQGEQETIKIIADPDL